MCQLYQVQSHDLPYEARVRIQYNMGYNYTKILEKLWYDTVGLHVLITY